MKKKTPTASPQPAACEFCASDSGGDVLWRNSKCRIVLVGDRDYPGFCRVIWNAHVKEMSDLTPTERRHCMRTVFAVERALRTLLAPDKINLASFGNVVPHLHWHIIPRSTGDAHFPNPVWGRRRRPDVPTLDSRNREKLRTALVRTLAKSLGVRRVSG